MPYRGKDITVIVPTSPIKSHPETHILEETLDSVRHHLPQAEIFLCFDGIRQEQWGLDQEYVEYTRRALWLADHKYKDVLPFVFDEHLHQSGMLRYVLPEVRTEYLLYVEHDTPLVTDESAIIDWTKILMFIQHGELDSIRFHHEAVIPPDHEPMMRGRYGDFLCTSQWSQRPHVASTAFYRRIMESHFKDRNTFIEDVMHGVCDNAYNLSGMSGWQQYRLAIYAPELFRMNLSYHTDGRAGATKYE